jgi:hypothetical protein
LVEGPARFAWRPGDVIVVRHVQHGRVWHADAAVVVEDAPERLIVYRPLGGASQASALDWSTGVFDGPHPRRRHTTDALTIVVPGAGHAVTAMYAGGGGAFLCWYVDLQAPFRRTPDGVVTCDQSLDIVIGPDRRWRWKDEDHLAFSVGLGWRTQAEADAIRAEGERVIAALERGDAPFSEPWPAWRADPAWPMPELPDDWSVVPP